MQTISLSAAAAGVGDLAGLSSDATHEAAALMMHGPSSSASSLSSSSPPLLHADEGAPLSSAVGVGSSVFAAPSSSSSAPQSSASPVADRVLESAVVSYLRKRGYAWTEEQLKAIRSGGSGGSGGSAGSAELSELAMDVSLDVHSCLTNSLFTVHPRLSTPEQYEWTYSRVRSFVSSSLDVYAVELRLVLWPLFLHSFLSLMLRGYPGDAILFFSAHRKDHEALHSPELTMLAHIHSEQHIRQHDYTRLALSRRIELTMSAFTCELLTAYIETEGLVTAAYMLTEHTQIKVLSRRPWKAEQSTLQQHINSSSVDKQAGQQGQAHTAVAAINSLDVRWGALPDIVSMQTEAREQLKETVRAQQRKEQQAAQEGDSRVSGSQMDVDGKRSMGATGVSGGGDTEGSRWAEGDQTAVKSTLGGDDDADDDGGGKGAAVRHSRRAGKKERKGGGGRKGFAADDSATRLANEQIGVFKHTVQQHTVELPDFTPEQRQTYIDDLTHRHTHLHTGATAVRYPLSACTLTDCWLPAVDFCMRRMLLRGSSIEQCAAICVLLHIHQRQSNVTSSLAHTVAAGLPATALFDSFSCSLSSTVRLLCSSMCSSTLSVDGSLAVAGFTDSSIQLWDLYASSGEADSTHSAALYDDSPAAVQRPLQSTAIGLDHTSSHSSLLSTASSLAAVTVTGLPRLSPARLLGHSGSVFGVSVSADQRFVLSSSDDTTIRLWHADTARNLVAYKGHTSTVWDVAFSPLSQHFASAAQSTY